MSCHVMSCHVMLCYVMSCHVMSCYVMLCYVTSLSILFSFSAVPFYFKDVSYFPFRYFFVVMNFQNIRNDFVMQCKEHEQIYEEEDKRLNLEEELQKQYRRHSTTRYASG